jgi:hypothetical protein
MIARVAMALPMLAALKGLPSWCSTHAHLEAAFGQQDFGGDCRESVP